MVVLHASIASVILLSLHNVLALTGTRPYIASNREELLRSGFRSSGTRSSTSALSLNRPIASQRPLIARVLQPYKWSLSPQTFTSPSSSPSAFTLSTSALPPWLSFDASTGTFSGQPNASDAGTIAIKVTATNNEDHGAVIADLFHILVSPNSPPVIHLSIAEQITANPTPPSISSTFPTHLDSSFPPNALRVPPNWSFSIGLQGSTFLPAPDGPGGDVLLSAGSEDGSGLPEWVTFSNKTITFDGSAPEEVEGHVFRLALFGSERWGFGAVQDIITLVVASHELYQVRSFPHHNISAGTHFSFIVDDFDGLFIDDEPAPAKDVTSVAVDCSTYATWVTFDPVTRRLEGTPPMDVGNEVALPLTLTHNVGATLSTKLSLSLTPSLFSSPELPPLIAPSGTHVSFSPFSGSRNAVSDANATYPNLPSPPTWLTFNQTTLVLSGTVPPTNELNYTYFTVLFSARSTITHAISHASLVVSFSLPASSNGGAGTADGGGNGSSEKTRMVLGVTLGTIGGVVVLCLFLIACRKWCGAHADNRPKRWERGGYVINSDESLAEKEKTLGNSTAYDGTFQNVELGEVGAVVPTIPHSNAESSIGSRTNSPQPQVRSNSPASSLKDTAKNLINRIMPSLSSVHHIGNGFTRKKLGPISKPKPLMPLHFGSLPRDDSAGSSMFFGRAGQYGATPTYANGGTTDTHEDEDNAVGSELPNTASSSAVPESTMAVSHSSKGLLHDLDEEGEEFGGSDEVTLGGDTTPKEARTLIKVKEEVGIYRLDEGETSSGRGSPDSGIALSGDDGSPEKPVRRADFKYPANGGMGVGGTNARIQPKDEISGSGSGSSLRSMLQGRRNEGKPRLVPFRHERTTAGSVDSTDYSVTGTGTRLVSQRVVVGRYSPPNAALPPVPPKSVDRPNYIALPKKPYSPEPRSDSPSDSPYSDASVDGADLSLGMRYVRAFGEDGGGGVPRSASGGLSAKSASAGLGKMSGKAIPGMKSGSSGLSSRSANVSTSRTATASTTSQLSSGQGSKLGTRTLTPPLLINGKQRQPVRHSNSHPSFISYGQRQVSTEDEAEETEKETSYERSLSHIGQAFSSGFGFSSQGSSSTTRSGSQVEHKILVGVNEPFNFSAPLPKELLETLVASGVKVLKASLDDGSPLPPWLHLDERDVEFWGVPEAGDRGLVKVRMSVSSDIVGEFVVEVVGR